MLIKLKLGTQLISLQLINKVSYIYSYTDRVPGEVSVYFWEMSAKLLILNTRIEVHEQLISTYIFCSGLFSLFSLRARQINTFSNGKRNYLSESMWNLLDI